MELKLYKKINCRMCWILTPIVFLLMVIVAVLVYVPLSEHFKLQEIMQVREVNRVHIEAVMNITPKENVKEIVHQIQNFSNNNDISAMLIYDLQGKKIGGFGKLPVQSLDELKKLDMSVDDLQADNVYLTVRPGQLNKPYWVLARLDKMRIIQMLDDFSFNIELYIILIASLISLISFIVIEKVNKKLEKTVCSRTKKLTDEISMRKFAEEKMQSMALFPEENVSPIMRIDENGILLYANPASEFILKEWVCVVNDTVPEEWFNIIKSVMQTKEATSLELKYADKYYWFDVTPFPRKAYANIYAVDVTERKKHEEKIVHLSSHDQATNLPGRSLAVEKIDHLLEAQDDTISIVLSWSFIEYTQLTSTIGYELVETFIKTFVTDLREVLPNDVLMARLANNKFILAQGELQNTCQAEILANKIIECASYSYEMQEQVISVNVNIGFSLYPNDANNADALIRHADLAMYQARAKGFNKIVSYIAGLNEEIADRLVLLRELKNAVKHDQLRLFVQGQYSSQERILQGAEALVRWQHPKLGLVPPLDFISLAEEAGYIDEIGEWVFKQSCLELKRWHAVGQKHLTISINVSTKQLEQRDFAARLKNIIDETGVEPRYLKLEITESVMLLPQEHVLNILNDLRDLGLLLSLDDFGTGYSSLTYLKELPIQQLKIDQSFVKDITDDQDSQAICYAIINLAHQMNMQVIAEGVEEEAQLLKLIEMNCDQIQGFLFLKPLPLDEFFDALA